MKLYKTTSKIKGPSIAIVGAVHGDEPIGIEAIKYLRKNIDLKKGSITFIIAHPEGVKSKTRHIHQDLNRSFPGKKSGNQEQQLAYHIRKIISKCDYVLDIHGTSSKLDRLLITTDFNKNKKRLLSCSTISKVALIRKNKFGKGSLIGASKCGVSLEYGPDKSTRRYKIVARDIEEILGNLEMLKNQRKRHRNKELYIVKDVLKTPKPFHQYKFKEFQKIKKNTPLGKNGKSVIFSSISFYPLFVSAGRYDETFSLVTDKKNIKL
ncbi:hypothetical protein CL654_02360 [bacterium]|nr:hypothetical protein [bacterium]